VSDERLRPIGETPASGEVSSDFVFGTLATDDLRVAQLRLGLAGIHHGHDLSPADPRPGEEIRVGVTVGSPVRADHVTCYFTTDGREPAGRRGRATVGEALELARTGVHWETLSWSYVEAWTATLPPQPAGTLVRYRIEAWPEREEDSRWATEMAGVVAGERPPDVAEAEGLVLAPAPEPRWSVSRRGSYAVHVDEERVPDWLRDAVIYQVFVDRFATAGNRPFARPATPGGFYGGTLRGVTEHLDHIEKLGATCIWLSPLFPSPSHHGYDATDYRSVEPRLGTDEDLRELLSAAHERGMRVILDLAVNHVSSGHPAFRRAIADRESPEAHWFTFTRWPDQYLSFFGVLDHPQIDSDDPGASEYMIESARQWLDLGVDGFRCDYANGPSHAFWSEFRAATRLARADSVTLGEVVETPTLQRTYAGRMDGCLDFVLLQALRRFFAFGDLSPGEFDAFLRRHLEFFAGDFVLPSFLDNHDMNRFLWVVGGDVRRLKLAALCQFTLPHPPIIYYGTEVGVSQRRDVRYADGSGHPEESRLPMAWGADQDRELLTYYRDLVRLRLEHIRLWRGTRQTLMLEDPGFYVYRCGDGVDQAVVVLNNGPDVQHFTPDPSGPWRVVLATGPGVELDGTGLTLGPLRGAVLIPAPAASGAAMSPTSGHDRD
jgi:cyclomaltodextrinase / maltogenic alpha-amylase / neopullulanase